MRTKSIANLAVSPFQARRIIRISFGSTTVEHTSPLTRGLWSQECALDGGLNHTATRYSPEEPLPLAFYNGWNLYPYITFGSGDGYITGITAYVKDRVIGYATHGRRYQLVGSNDGKPMHFPLRHDERIVSVWVGSGESRLGNLCHYLLVSPGPAQRSACSPN